MVRRTLDGEAPHPDVALALRRAADLCHGLGHGVEPVEAIVDGGAVARAFRTIWGYLAREAAASVQPLLAGRAIEDILEPWTIDLADWGSRLGSADLEQAIADGARATQDWASAMTRYDAELGR